MGVVAELVGLTVVAFAPRRPPPRVVSRAKLEASRHLRGDLMARLIGVAGRTAERRHDLEHVAFAVEPNRELLIPMTDDAHHSPIGHVFGALRERPHAVRQHVAHMTGSKGILNRRTNPKRHAPPPAFLDDPELAQDAPSLDMGDLRGPSFRRADPTLLPLVGGQASTSRKAHEPTNKLSESIGP